MTLDLSLEDGFIKNVHRFFCSHLYSFIALLNIYFLMPNLSRKTFKLGFGRDFDHLFNITLSSKENLILLSFRICSAAEIIHTLLGLPRAFYGC